MADSSTVIVDQSTAPSRVVTNNQGSTTIASRGPAIDGTYQISERSASSLESLADVTTAGRMNNDILKYNAAAGRWLPAPGTLVLEANETVPAGIRPGTLIFRRQ